MGEVSAGDAGAGVYFELLNVSKRFPGVQALSNVSVTFRQGEVHSLVGENGAGKSTLVSIVMGLQLPDEGRLLLDGKAVRFQGPADALAAGIAMVPQELNLVPYLSVAENVMLGAAPRRVGGTLVDWSAMRSRTGDALKSIGANIVLDAPAANLSVAQQQMVQIARALALGAKLLILDEPTASLSLPESERLLAVVEQLRRSRCAIIYISHRLKEVLRISDRVSVMRNGHLVAQIEDRSASEADLIRFMIGKAGDSGATARSPAAGVRRLALEVKNLSRTGEFSDISFQLHEGEILGVAGLVGAGRTEMARCVFGDTQPTSGQILVAGRRVRHALPTDAIANGIAYVPEERKKLGIFPMLGVAENMTIAAMSRFRRRGKIDFRAVTAATAEYVSKLAIRTAGRDQPIVQLSGGNQQKVILGRWLLTGCNILILDEPTRGIDVNAKFEIHALLRRLADTGMAIMAISSEMEEVLGLSDRILVMREGRLAGELAGPEATQERLLTLAMSDRKQPDQRPIKSELQ